LHSQAKTPPFFQSARLEAGFVLRKLQRGETLTKVTNTMNSEKKRKLESKGWRTGSTREFLGLSERESSYIELKLKLGENLKKIRLEKHLTQIDLAKLLRSNQSRVAKMEAGDPSVSIDLLIKSLLALGTSHQELAGIISQN